mmetsp:Transcript_112050/g.323728  ORF Transcript_112050/g.323728 Transcript_112050/m.323728 type:complete len:352 (-) Transcript_112050:831-1886(-)
MREALPSLVEELDPAEADTESSAAHGRNSAADGLSAFSVGCEIGELHMGASTAAIAAAAAAAWARCKASNGMGGSCAAAATVAADAAWSANMCAKHATSMSPAECRPAAAAATAAAAAAAAASCTLEGEGMNSETDGFVVPCGVNSAAEALMEVVVAGLPQSAMPITDSRDCAESAVEALVGVNSMAEALSDFAFSPPPAEALEGDASGTNAVALALKLNRSEGGGGKSPAKYCSKLNCTPLEGVPIDASKPGAGLAAPEAGGEASASSASLSPPLPALRPATSLSGCWPGGTWTHLKPSPKATLLVEESSAELSDAWINCLTNNMSSRAYRLSAAPLFVVTSARACAWCR